MRPAIAPRAPASASRSATVSVRAPATDNVGVIGVQFKLDGANLGGEITVAPYVTPWNTISASNGSHTLTAAARDTAGNQATSAAVTVVVNNDTVPPVISGVSSSGVTTSGATINWTTNEPSDTQVDYGLTTAYGSSMALNTGLV